MQWTHRNATQRNSTKLMLTSAFRCTLPASELNINSKCSGNGSKKKQKQKKPENSIHCISGIRLCACKYVARVCGCVCCSCQMSTTATNNFHILAAILHSCNHPSNPPTYKPQRLLSMHFVSSTVAVVVVVVVAFNHLPQKISIAPQACLFSIAALALKSWGIICVCRNAAKTEKKEVKNCFSTIKCCCQQRVKAIRRFAD